MGSLLSYRSSIGPPETEEAGGRGRKVPFRRRSAGDGRGHVENREGMKEWEESKSKLANRTNNTKFCMSPLVIADQAIV